MQKKVKIAVMAFCYSPLVFAQNVNSENQAKVLDENAFTFTEAQLGEDDNMSQNVTILNSTNNAYASEVGFLFSPMRFRYRALNQKYNEVYINGASMNDMESGQFRFSNIGGLNRFTRNVEFALPFESNNFAYGNIAGSNNYDFRAGSMEAGQYISLAGANRNYTLRGMYTYASGFNEKGWAVAAGLTYRWANRGYVEGTFYNALSYFFGVQKIWNNGHSLSFTTWGNPTERSTQGASTDEAYWMANDYYYNPYWGYQNGHKRNSRVVNDFAPSGILTWDWDINDKTKLTTSVFGKYSMYKSTKLNYNNAENPQPDYWKNMPSSYYDVWGNYNAADEAQWQRSYDYWTSMKMHRQINWDRLYYANKNTDGDAIYYIQAKHNDNLMLSMSSALTHNFTEKQTLNVGINLAANTARHYQTIDDLLGASEFHNINTYAVGEYALSNPLVQYDLNTVDASGNAKSVGVGDTFGYDYRLNERKAQGWLSWSEIFGIAHYTAAAKIGYTNMYRNGYMRNGLFADNSYGKSKKADFVDGGVKLSSSFAMAPGHTLALGIGYEKHTPTAATAFSAPEMNNDFVLNLKNENIYSAEASYQFQNGWLHANIGGYYNYMSNGTEWQNFYFDDVNSFTYVSLTNLRKAYYGLEAGLNAKLTSWLNFKAVGTISEAKYLNNATATYLISTKANVTSETVYSKNMRESGTPLKVASLGLDYHLGGWYIDLNANYYDDIYLSWSPSMRYESTLKTTKSIDINTGEYIAPEQAKGKGGWMVDGSIGKSFRLRNGHQLNFNFSITNILNNQKMVSGGYEQSRSDYTVTDAGDYNKARTYKFSKNSKKYYVFGTNGMFQVSYRF
jgi:hypothetical protein